MNKIIYLPVETIARELDAKILFMHKAISRGYEVVIGRKSFVKQYAQHVGSGVFINKHHGKTGLPDMNKKCSFIFIALDEEGLVFTDDNLLIKQTLLSESDHLDLIFTWGDYQKELFVNHFPDLDRKIISVGNPRFDLLRKEYDEFVKYTLSVDFDSHGINNYFLINTNFTAANIDREYQMDIHELAKKNCLEMGWHYEHSVAKMIDDYLEYHNYLIKEYILMLNKLADCYPNISFILRPHPSEDLEMWKNVLNKPNIKVIQKGNVISWIYNAYAVIHTGCTTGVEAWALRKPVIQYNPCENMGLESRLPNELSYKADSIPALCSVIDNVLDGNLGDCFNERLNIVKPYVKNIEGLFSADRMLDAIDDLSNVKNVEVVNCNYYYSESFKSVLRRNIKSLLPDQLWRFLISRNFPLIRKVLGSTQKFPGIRAKDIENKLHVFDLIHGYNSNGYSINEIAADTFVITSNSR